MLIGIDATALPSQPVGAGNYMIQLIRALADLPRPSEYIIFVQPHRQGLIGLQEYSHVHFQQMPVLSPAARLIWEQTRFPGIIRRSGVDLLHSLHYTMPLSKPVTQVVTIHDLTYFIFPEYHVISKRYFFHAFIKLSSRRADALITYSQSTRQDAIRLVGIPAQKLFNAPLGVTNDFHPINDLGPLTLIRDKYSLPEKFILFVGLLEPRKNVITLLRAYKELLSHIDTHRLVIVGRMGWMYSRLLEILEELKLRSWVHFTGYVAQEDLPGIYNLADVFVYPSFYEGFGLPVLEAMACGTPVITSNVSSMPEIVDDAGVLIDPRDVKALHMALTQLIEDTAYHQELSRKALRQAAPFTWQRTAQITQQVYQKVLSDL